MNPSGRKKGLFSGTGLFFLTPDKRANYAAASQYPALNGLLMRSANGDTSTNLSVGIFSPDSVVRSMPETAFDP